MKGGFDRSQSLEELEQNAWGEPSYNSYLVTTIHRLRRKPLADLNVEDLRIMIGQGIGLPFLVPLAIERLEVEPLAAGDFYPGDLLKAVMHVGEEFWPDHPDSHQRLRKIIGEVKVLLPSLNEEYNIVREILGSAPGILTA